MPISTSHWLSADTVEGDDWASLLQERWDNFVSSFRDKIDVKHVYSEVIIVFVSQFIRPAVHASEPIADLQGNTLQIPQPPVSLDRHVNKVIRPMTMLTLHTAEEYTTCIDADHKQDFRKCSFYRELPIRFDNEVQRMGNWWVESPVLGSGQYHIFGPSELRFTLSDAHVLDNALHPVRLYSGNISPGFFCENDREAKFRSHGAVAMRFRENPSSFSGRTVLISVFHGSPKSPQANTCIVPDFLEAIATTTDRRGPRWLSGSKTRPDQSRIFGCGSRACRTMPLVAGFSRGSPVPPHFHFNAAPHSPHAFIGSQDLAVKSCPKLFTHSPYYRLFTCGGYCDSCNHCLRRSVGPTGGSLWGPIRGLDSCWQWLTPHAGGGLERFPLSLKDRAVSGNLLRLCPGEALEGMGRTPARPHAWVLSARISEPLVAVVTLRESHREEPGSNPSRITRMWEVWWTLSGGVFSGYSRCLHPCEPLLIYPHFNPPPYKCSRPPDKPQPDVRKFSQSVYTDASQAYSPVVDPLIKRGRTLVPTRASGLSTVLPAGKWSRVDGGVEGCFSGAMHVANGGPPAAKPCTPTPHKLFNSPPENTASLHPDAPTSFSKFPEGVRSTPSARHTADAEYRRLQRRNGGNTAPLANNVSGRPFANQRPGRNFVVNNREHAASSSAPQILSTILDTGTPDTSRISVFVAPPSLSRVALERILRMT
ncbi:hypothetical protein PR048_031238 [Dryococelus australis]|uniref:Uncharacterized protein n=1 Tax=Dryococelus australis TaxID=614101 RepID=A0ABQ9G8T2_9NEOP|nr:hypothetical protein PR048_031238 [Dryococelus australis]